MKATLKKRKKNKNIKSPYQVIFKIKNKENNTFSVKKKKFRYLSFARRFANQVNRENMLITLCNNKGTKLTL